MVVGLVKGVMVIGLVEGVMVVSGVIFVLNRMLVIICDVKIQGRGQSRALPSRITNKRMRLEVPLVGCGECSDVGHGKLQCNFCILK